MQFRKEASPALLTLINELSLAKCARKKKDAQTEGPGILFVSLLAVPSVSNGSAQA